MLKHYTLMLELGMAEYLATPLYIYIFKKSKASHLQIGICPLVSTEIFMLKWSSINICEDCQETSWFLELSNIKLTKLKIIRKSRHFTRLKIVYMTSHSQWCRVCSIVGLSYGSGMSDTESLLNVDKIKELSLLVARCGVNESRGLVDPLFELVGVTILRVQTQLWS